MKPFKTIVSISLVMLLSLMLFLPVAMAKEGASDDPVTFVVVNTVDELIAAIKSDTTILLEPGKYNLDKTAGSTNPNVWYETKGFTDSYYSPTGAAFSNVKNLKIYAYDAASVLLYSTNPEDNVLILNNCTNVTFDHITLGHDVSPAEVCCAGVVYLLDNTNTRFTQCDVYGCGTVGFSVDDSTNVVINKTTIHDCLYGAADIFNSTNVTFLNSTIRNNGNTHGSALFYFEGASNIKLNNCVIRDNGCKDDPAASMFDSNKNRILSLKDCTLNDNQYAKLFDAAILKGPLPKYKVQFKLNGGKGAPPKSQTVYEGKTAVAPADPSRSGYTFGGWYKEAACINAWDFSADIVTGNITLYAKWESSTKYTITAVPNKSSYGTVEGGGIYDKSALVLLTALPNPNYLFVKWQEGRKPVSYNYQYQFAATKSRSLTAVFAAIGTPSIKSVTASGKNSLKITWKKLTGVTGYYVYRSDNSKDGFVKIGDTKNTSIINTGLPKGTKYYYKVQAYYAAGDALTYGGYSTAKSGVAK